jgi:uncharacterized membrane protein
MKMNKGHIILIILLIFLISAPLLKSATTSDDRSYTISKATVDLYVQQDGSLKVKEKLHYSFQGTYNGVYRDIPIYTGERIENLNISTNGAYSTYEVTNKSNMKSVKVYLYSDQYHINPITDRDVDVIIEYDFINVITIYNDIAELQYKVWGEYWDVEVGQLTTNVHLPTQYGVKYWLNPPYYVASSTWQGSVLNLVTGSIPSGNYFEVRLTIPKEQFNNPVFARQVNINALTQIEKIQNDYQNNINFYSILYYILGIFMLLSLIIPFWIYFKYGREPKTTYQGEYESEPPTNDPPAMVNAISGKGYRKDVGKPDMEGYQSTIMDLINRGYLGIESVADGKKNKKSVIIKFTSQTHSNELDSHEIDAIILLKSFSVGGVLNLNNMKKKLKDKDKALTFKTTYETWQYGFSKQYLSESTLKEYFISEGNKYTKNYGIIALILSGAVYYFIRTSPLPAASFLVLASIILAITGVICLISPPKVVGRWTQKGVDYHAKWQAFKNYLEDFSLIKEYPPESVAIWNKYLVYATALGVADKVRKSMEISLPEEQLNQSNIYLFHYYGGYTALSSGLSTGMSTSSSSGGGVGGSGGVGGAGGGSGGGGGGAF